MSYRNYRHPIYGIKQRPNNQCPECPNIMGAFQNLQNLLFNVGRTVQTFFPSASIVSVFRAPMGVRAYLGPALFVRMVWRQTHSGVSFDVDNPIHRLQIKDIYLVYGMDYLNDPLFKDALGLTLRFVS